jgi:SPP1 gp7 family putative phage head morphogenesis protein
MPSIYDTSLEFKRAMLARELRVMENLADRWSRIADSIRADLEDLTRHIQQLEEKRGTITITMLRQQERYQTLLAQAIAQAAQYAAEVQRIVAAQVATETENAVNDAIHIIDRITHGVIGIGFDTIDTGAVTALAGLLADGSPIRNVLIKRFGDQWQQAEDAIINGMAKGFNPRKIADLIVQDLTNTTLSDALRITRTETLRAYRDATQETYTQSGAVKFYRRLATKDTRTCAACLALDGTKYPVGTPVWDHPNGRCTSVPIVEGFPEVKWQSGADWFRNLDESEQRDILGPAKFEAWKAGQFSFDDLAVRASDPTWGGTVKVASAADLGIAS